MQEGGFRLNAVASGLKRRRTTTIGTVLHETLPNPFFAEVALGIEQGASELGHNVLVYNARGSAEHERQGVEALLSQQVEAIVFAKPVDARQRRAGARGGHRPSSRSRSRSTPRAAPCSSTTTSAPRRRWSTCSTSATPRSASSASRRRTRTASVVDRVVHERVAAYRDALRARDLPPDDSLVVLGEYFTDAGWPSLRTGHDYMTRLLGQHPEVTAVLAGSDLLAAGALQALYERRIRVPDEASVIGFDDTFAGHLAPPLTTVRQPMFEMGARAAALALDLAESSAAGAARGVAADGARRPQLHRPAQGEPMKAALLTEPFRIALVDRELAPLGPQQVRLRVDQCGICTSELDLWTGKAVEQLPAAIGHEVAGIVEEVGADVTTLRAGDRVAAWVEGGGFAEAAVVEERFCIPVAAGVTYAAVAEPLACIVNSVELAAPALADDIVIIGAGYMGNLLQLVSALKGPRTVTVADIRPDALERARSLGATRVVDTARESLADAVREVTDGRGADVTYEVTGTGPGLALAGEVTRMSGKLCIVGYHQGGERSIPLATWNWMAFELRERALPRHRHDHARHARRDAARQRGRARRRAARHGHVRPGRDRGGVPAGDGQAGRVRESRDRARRHVRRQAPRGRTSSA